MSRFWLEVEVDGEILAPRQLITTVFFALNAERATEADMADDADRVDGYEGADLDQSAHASQTTGNPHNLSASDVGAATSTDTADQIQLHSALESAHHAKTTGFGELTGQAEDAQIPSLIARDAELDWTNLSGIPVGFLDGIDDGTSYIPGTGLDLSGTTLNVEVPLVLSSAGNSISIQGTNTGDGSGVYGKNDASGYFGFLGSNTLGVSGGNLGMGNFGYLGTSEYGVHGFTSGNDTADRGVYGEHANGNSGYLGGNGYGAYGKHESTSNWGALGNALAGVEANSANGKGVAGGSLNGDGVWGTSGHGNGIHGSSTNGRAGYFEGGGSRVAGATVYATNSNSTGIAGYFQNNSDDATAVFVQQGIGDVLRGFYDTGSGWDYAIRVQRNGWTTLSVLELTGGADLSEQFDVSGAEDEAIPGMVVIIDTDNPGQLRVSEEAYDRKVAGIISGAGGVQPGMLMAQKGSEADGANPVALTGRVYCWADASYGRIEPGDMLTTSNTPGHAMRVADHQQAQGAVIGKAMSSLDEGTGLVLVLVSLQ
jgi:hypothetical protein